MKTVLAVDGNSILNRAFYGVRPLTTSTGLFTNAVYGFATILQRHIDELKPDALAVAFDLKSPTFRHKMYDGYKANRKGMPDELAMQLPYAKKCAEYMGGRVLTLEGYEADDILGTISGMARASDGQWQAFILTGDRDSLQLIDGSTTVLLATNKDTVVFDRENFIKTYGVFPEQFVDVKSLMGDSSDNIPGVPGIGEKTALKLISDFGSLDSVYSEIESPKIAAGVRKKLEGSKDLAFLSKTLAKIETDAPLGISVEAMLRRDYHNQELLKLFKELEFNGLIKRFGLSDEKPSAETKSEVSEDPGKFIGCEKLALIYNRSTLQISTDKNTVYTAEMSGEDYSEYLKKLSASDTRLIVFDSKSVYAVCDSATVYFDVMLASYVCDPGEGAITPAKVKLKYLDSTGDEIDSAELFGLYEILSGVIAERKQEKLLFEIEQPLAKVLSKMERYGFRIDRDGLAVFTEKLASEAAGLAEQIYALAGCTFNINSPKQLGNVLFERLGLPAGKKTQSGYSTGAEVLEKLAPYYPIVGCILEYRQLTKLKSTYGDGLAQAADSENRIHTSFNQTITATGRLSSTEPNLQNIPVRTEMGREMRRFFIPDGDNRALVDADYSQIELRLLAEISGDEGMIKAFRDGIDIHTVTASQVFGVPVESVTGEMRKRAKAVNFGIVYGISDFSLAQDIGVTKRQAAEYIEAYLSRYPKVAEYLRRVVEEAARDGYVTTLFGRRRYIPELASSKKMLRAFGERVAMNSPIQGTAADIIKIAMVNVDKALSESRLDAKLILQVHDELIVDAAEKDADKVRDILKYEMENAVNLSVPLTVSVSVGRNWYECKD